MDTRLTIEIPLSLKKQLNAITGLEGISLKDYLLNLIEKDLKKRKPVTLNCNDSGISIAKQQ